MDSVATAAFRVASPGDARAAFRTREFTALGTRCRIMFMARSEADGTKFSRDVVEWICQFEQRYSRFVPGSLVSRVNAAAGRHPVAIDEEFASLLSLCDSFHWLTQGIFDPTALPLLDLWDYRGDTPRIPADADIDAARCLIGWRQVQHDDRQVYLPVEGMGIDIGGIGKEYAVDRIVEMAAERGIQNVLVDLGRDIRGLGRSPGGGPWRIGLEDPGDPGQCWAGLGITNRALATSGDYARCFEAEGMTFGHIIDPRSGRPVHHAVRSVSVVARTCTEAGVLSTAAFVMGPVDGLQLLERSQQVEGALWAPRECRQTRGFSTYLLGAS